MTQNIDTDAVTSAGNTTMGDTDVWPAADDVAEAGAVDIANRDRCHVKSCLDGDAVADIDTTSADECRKEMGKKTRVK